jgi:Ca-activated chloride channel family protein
MATLAAGLISLAIAVSPAHAQENIDSGPQYTPTMLILDASGSMDRPDPAGTMMDAAKNAVHTFVDTAPAESKVGLTVYGTGTGNDDAEKEAGCRDVQVLHKPGTLDRNALNSAVDGITASGWTPMGPALRQAAAELPDTGPRSIVLVSDGEDTCAPPDACEVARELETQGIDLVLHTIGFAVDDAARTQLTCMAEVTGGTYTDAADGAALERTLPQVTSAALRNYDSAGAPITGTPAYDNTPVAEPGQYLDTIGQKETRYYAVDVPDGATAYFSGTISFPRLPDIETTEDTNVLSSRVYGRDGRDCNEFVFEQVVNSSDGAALTVAEAFTGATEKRAEDGSSADKCRGGGRYYFTLEWSTVSAGVPERLPIEVLVGIEPAVIDPGPSSSASPIAFVEPDDAGTAVVGGGSFNAATELGGSGRYTDTVRPGEFVFYRVPLDWGQGLAYRVHFDANGTRGVENVSNITTTLYAPTREEIVGDFTSYTGTDNVLPSNEPALATAPIRYDNRNSDELDIRKEALTGWYYIAVKVGSTREGGENRPVPIRLDLTVSGNTEQVPSYSAPMADGIFGENSVANASSGDGRAKVDGNDGEATASDTTAEDPATTIGVSPIGIAVAAGVVVLVAVASGFAVRARRK